VQCDARMAPAVVLASTSPYRRQLLERLGLAFTVEAPGVDESAIKRASTDPAETVRKLAAAKANAVAARHAGAIVIGSDQAAVADGAVLDKPGSADAAHAQLQRLQGREHFLMTAVAIVHAGGTVEFVDTARLVMRKLTAAEIERYVAADRPLDCAGSYKFENRGIALFERVEAADQTAITGLPLLRLCAELRALGVTLP
jgi:septum formation protein